MSKFVWFEYVSKEQGVASRFFGELFGWTTQEVPVGGDWGNYQMIASGERTIGGYSPPPPGAPAQAHWLAHLGVANARETGAAIEKHGGKVLKQPMKVGDFGTLAIVSDPQGATFALWQPAKTDELPAPTTNTFCWNELASSDPAASVAFYTAIGGFTEKRVQMEQGEYHVLEAGGQPRAGIMAKMMPQQPHAWLAYVQVASADKTADKAAKLGATVLVPPTDIPNVGRFAIFADPQGAPLGVLQP